MSCSVNGYKIGSIWCPPDVFVSLPCQLWVFCWILRQRTSFCGRCRLNVRHAASADVSFQRTTPYLLLFLLRQYTTVGFVAFTIWLRLGRVEERSISNCRKKDAVRSAKKHTDTDTILQTFDISVNKKFDLRNSDTVTEHRWEGDWQTVTEPNVDLLDGTAARCFPRLLTFWMRGYY